MNRFPLFLSLSGRRVAVLGAGEAAAAKVRLLRAAGAEILDGEIDGADLVVIASADDAPERAAEARRAGALVNVVDRPELSDFIIPSIVDRGDVVVAISTDGAAPVLARRLRAKIEALLPPRLGALAAFARAFRPAVAGKIAPPLRRRFWERFFDGPIAARILAGDEGRARQEMLAEVSRPSTDGLGVVHLVGAGPGDPELLTLKAHRLLQEADVILHDRLVSADILNLARRDARRLYVGKSRGEHSVPQEEIAARLIAFAREGLTVVRLKGGDPFIFGRGGEELEAVRAAGVPVFVTPGVTAALGCAASAGVPLTLRGIAQTVTLVTGHARADGELEVDWTALARLGHTIAVYMGVGSAGDIAASLIAGGLPRETPVAVIENGTRADERVLKGDLNGLAALVSSNGVEGPALLVIGEVARSAQARDFAEIFKEAA